VHSEDNVPVSVTTGAQSVMVKMAAKTVLFSPDDKDGFLLGSGNGRAHWDRGFPLSERSPDSNPSRGTAPSRSAHWDRHCTLGGWAWRLGDALFAGSSCLER